MNKNVVFEMRLIAACCSLGIVFSIAQFALDTWGTTAKGCRSLRKNATGDILAGMCNPFVKEYYDVCGKFAIGLR